MCVLHVLPPHVPGTPLTAEQDKNNEFRAIFSSSTAPLRLPVGMVLHLFTIEVLLRNQRLKICMRTNLHLYVTWIRKTSRYNNIYKEFSVNLDINDVNQCFDPSSAQKLIKSHIVTFVRFQHFYFWLSITQRD